MAKKHVPSAVLFEHSNQNPDATSVLKPIVMAGVTPEYDVDLECRTWHCRLTVISPDKLDPLSFIAGIDARLKKRKDFCGRLSGRTNLNHGRVFKRNCLSNRRVFEHLGPV